MRKFLFFIAAVFALTFFLTACGKAEEKATPVPVVATTEATPVEVEPSKEKPVKEAPVSLNGEWVDEIFVAVISNDSIVINIVDEETSSLYWKGTFSAEGKDVTSVADRDALDASMLGSQDDEKVFTIKDDTISFDFTMMGTTKAVHLKQR
jgi:hypothetical protein